MSRLKIDYDLCNRVFVYGTLKSGHHNNLLLGGASFLSESTTEQGFLLLNYGVPVAVPRSLVQAPSYPRRYGDTRNPLEGLYGASQRSYEALPVRGEVYQLHHKDDFIRLDKLEGHPDLYYRSLTPVLGVGLCWMYMWPYGPDQEDDTCPVIDGAYEWQS